MERKLEKLLKQNRINQGPNSIGTLNIYCEGGYLWVKKNQKQVFTNLKKIKRYRLLYLM